MKMSLPPPSINMYKLKKPNHLLSPIASVPPDDDQNDDSASDESDATWKSGLSGKSRYSPISSVCSPNNNNQSQTDPTTPSPHDEQPPLQHGDSYCPHDKNSNQLGNCLKNFYEDDEVCRVNKQGRLEFGIVSKNAENGNNVSIFWTLGATIQEETINPENPASYAHIRLVDRRSQPGDTIQVHKKRGEVQQVSWGCHIQILENNLSLLNVSCDDLEPLIPYHAGQKIEHSGWLGTITNVSTEATLMFTGAGKTGIVDCAYLPPNQQPFPGQKVKYTVDSYIQAKLTFLDDNRPVSKVFKDYHVVEAFVLFIHVSKVEVKWSGRIKFNGVDNKGGNRESVSNPSQQPPTILSKSNLKKNTRVLGTIKDKDWEECSDCGEQLFQYNVRDVDEILWEGDVEDYLRAKFFGEEEETRLYSCVSVKDLRRTSSKVCTNVAYNVKVLRLSRLVEVKWLPSGKIEKIPASAITEKNSLNVPVYQIVQQCLPLAPYSLDRFGVTLSCNSSEIVQVQWIEKCRDDARSSYALSAYSYQRSHQSPEPLYNLEHHYAFGELAPRAIVFRSAYCRISEGLFSLGWVRSITPLGNVIVVSVHTKQEHALYPLDLETTGLKIDGDSTTTVFRWNRYTDLVKRHGMKNLRNADKIFMRNLSLPDSSINFPEHFTLLQQCPINHTFFKNRFSVRSDGTWMRAVKKDQTFLTTRMNEDIGSMWIKGFRDRLDLFSVLIAAPQGTPYEGIVYSLDLQLVPEYPSSPPQVYLHTAIGRLRSGIQNLELHDSIIAPYTLVDSLHALQTMLFVGTESFDIPSSAASLQRRATLVSRGNEDRLENARIIIDVLDLMFQSVMNPPKLWATEVINYFLMTFGRTKDRLHGLLDMTNPYSTTSSDGWIVPTFPLMPVSDGFVESVLARLNRFDELLAKSAL